MFTKETIKNKLYSILIISVGILSTFIDGDYTFFGFSLFLGLPLFFTKTNWIT